MKSASAAEKLTGKSDLRKHFRSVHLIFYTLIEQSFQMSSVKLITLSAEPTSQFCTAVFLDNIADLSASQT